MRKIREVLRHLGLTETHHGSIEVLLGARAFDLDLGEARQIEHCNSGAHGGAFLRDLFAPAVAPEERQRVIRDCLRGTDVRVEPRGQIIMLSTRAAICRKTASSFASNSASERSIRGRSWCASTCAAE